MKLRLAVASALALGAFVAASPSRADGDARRLFQALEGRLAPSEAHRALGFVDDHLGVTAELPPGVDARERGLVPITGRLAVARGSFAALSRLVAQNPDVGFRWSPPLRPQLDEVVRWTGTTAARTETGLDGSGVVVGVVDTGVDTKHPSLRHPNGRTRVRWLIDFGQEPRGLHPDLEAAYGCTEEQPCAIFSAADIDALLDEDAGEEPHDTVGHGTHVASIAAGNGEPDGRYVGVAPGADLIVAQVGSPPSGSILDVNILTAARFVFERAEELRAPAVVNVSLGSNFGAHDGSSALEMGLAELLDRPGRVIVAAAGNSAGQVLRLSPHYQEPFGIHTEVHVAPPSEARVPLIAPAASTRTLRAAIFAWISSPPGDDLRIGFDNGRGRYTELVPRGQAATFRSDRLGENAGYTVTIVNGVRDNPQGVPLSDHGAFVVISGDWQAGRTFALRFGGHGNARLWVDSSGDLDPNRSPGVFLPASRKAGTIAVPASHPELIAVGATTNRTAWIDHTGAQVEQLGHGALERAPGDTTAYFSAAGPTNTGALKPDLLAPGVHVIAAMAAEADPRAPGTRSTQFAGACPPSGQQCLVVSDHYALASGTSMAAPAVTGAVALLLQRDPSLTQARVRALLQAGSRPLEGVVFVPEQAGAGALDVVGALRAQDAAGAPALAPTQARIELARSFAYPDPSEPLQALVVLRGEGDRPAAGFDRHRLALRANPDATVTFTPVTEGLWQARVAVPPGTGGRTLELTLTFDDQVLATRSVPIAVDPHAATAGFRTTGACTVAGPPLPAPQSTLLWLWGALPLGIGLLRLRERRRRSEAQRRTTTTGERS